MARIDVYFETMLDYKASDLHLSTGNQPVIRINGELQHLDAPVLEHTDLQEMLHEICPDYKWKTFEETGDVDFGYEYPGKSRLRANFFNQKYGIAAVFRTIPTEVLTAEQLGLPEVCRKFAKLKKGLVLITGPTGSGKSTTMAAMIDYANKHRSDHILTVEDPIEFVHTSQKALINHREVGIHTESFASALRGALREDPDIILVGEILVVDTPVANIIREGKTHQIPGLIEVGKQKGNVPLDDAIMDHLEAGRIDPEEAFDKCISKNKFLPFLTREPEPWEL
jgi:twitching motility protein PilT